MTSGPRVSVLLVLAGALLAGSCRLSDRPQDESERGRERTDQTAATGPSRPGGRATEPFFDLRSVTVEYAGPGRDAPAPDRLAEVRVGWFGPSDADDPLDGGLWQAVEMALDEAGGTIGSGGLPICLMPVWSRNPWGTGIKAVTGLVYDAGVQALVGAPDGPSAHLVEQVTAKARLAFVNSVSTDKTTNLTNVPWIFSCAPSDSEIAAVLARAVECTDGERPVALVSSTAHDARLLAAEVRIALERSGCPLRFHLEFQPSEQQFATQLSSLEREEPACLVLIAGPRASVRFLTAARTAGLDLRVYGGPALERSLVAAMPTDLLGDVVFPVLWDRDGEAARTFRTGFECRVGRGPDYAEAYTYDSVRILLAALRVAGPNRAAVRDALRDLSPWRGVTGTVRWDPTGRNVGARIALATYRDGRIVPFESGGERAGQR